MMFIGHFAAGLAAKAIDERPSLGTFFFAAQFIDLLWPIFLLLGLEHVNVDPGNTEFTPLDFVYYPFTHSFLAVLIWAVLFGAIYFFMRKNLRSALLLGTLVMSHWLLDLITHRPDLPLAFGDNIKVGFGLWNSVPLTIIIEVGMFICGSFMYLKNTKAQNNVGNMGLWIFLAFLAVMYFLAAFGPPPPSPESVKFAGLSMWLLVAWGYWIDKNRNPVRNGLPVLSGHER